MKKIIVFATLCLMLVSCTGTRYTAYHHKPCKPYGNGNWGCGASTVSISGWWK